MDTKLLFNQSFRNVISFLRAVLVLSFIGIVLNLPAMLPIFITISIVLGILMGWGMFLPNSQLFGKVFSEGNPNQRMIALTFDDGPSKKNTALILDILKEYNVPATFFVVGNIAEKHSELLKRMAEDGHEIENHTLKHPVLQAVFPIYYKSKIQKELQKCNEIIRSNTGKTPKFVRFPAGIKSLPLMEASANLNLIVAGFTVRSYDSKGIFSVQNIVSRITENVFPGAIVLLHDGYEKSKKEKSPTVEALPLILDFLYQNKYKCVSLLTLYKAKNI